jgi:hypothetical protein
MGRVGRGQGVRPDGFTDPIPDQTKMEMTSMSPMPVRNRIAFGLYLIIATGAVAVGLRYSCSPRIMPYHQQALGVSWDDLGPREQSVLLALLRGTGLCALITGLTVMTLLLIPFRRGERWVRWAISGLSFLTLIPALYESATLAAATGATTPWPTLVVAIAVTLVAFCLARPATDSEAASARLLARAVVEGAGLSPVRSIEVHWQTGPERSFGQYGNDLGSGSNLGLDSALLMRMPR